MKESLSIIKNFVEDRPTLKEYNSPPVLLDLLETELQELKEAYENEPEDHWGRELADVLYFALTFAYMTGIDIEAEFREKSARNLLKYEARHFQEGDGKETIQRLKQEWKETRGDEKFYDTD